MEATFLTGQEDLRAFMSHVASITSDQISEAILRNGQVDKDSADSIQTILTESDKDPSNVTREALMFAETASCVIKIHTSNIYVPEASPWVLSKAGMWLVFLIFFGRLHFLHRHTAKRKDWLRRFQLCLRRYIAERQLCDGH